MSKYVHVYVQLELSQNLKLTVIEQFDTLCLADWYDIRFLTCRTSPPPNLLPQSCTVSVQYGICLNIMIVIEGIADAAGQVSVKLERAFLTRQLYSSYLNIISLGYTWSHHVIIYILIYNIRVNMNPAKFNEDSKAPRQSLIKIYLSTESQLLLIVDQESCAPYVCKSSLL